MATQTVDRDREDRLLRNTIENVPALIVLRGRRRVGKSFLLRVSLDEPRLISYQAEEEPRALQMESFAAECARIIPGAPQLAFADWSEALRFLEAQARAEGPVVVVMDEFQRVAAQDPAIESTIQNACDRWDHENVPVALVLSGSALSFMAGLFKGGKPTHGRSVYRPLLLPLSYRDVAAFGPPKASPTELLERFSIIRDALVDLLGKPIAESNALCPDRDLCRSRRCRLRMEVDQRARRESLVRTRLEVVGRAGSAPGSRRYAGPSVANAERWAAGLPVPGYAMDDETAMKVVGGTVEVVSEGHWERFNPSPKAREAG